ncbi:hypothetical protein BMS3Bbin02_00048 [bacterium BMS3Bbin02]|nr:hypothetical protein BMS3Bbin02_00048 [bacterium BMS3Bbin02]
MVAIRSVFVVGVSVRAWWSGALEDHNVEPGIRENPGRNSSTRPGAHDYHVASHLRVVINRVCAWEIVDAVDAFETARSGVGSRRPRSR